MKPLKLLLTLATSLLALSACNDDTPSTVILTVGSSGDEHLSIAPAGNRVAVQGFTLTYTVVAEDGFEVSAAVGGSCPAGSWDGSVYETGAIQRDCEVIFSSVPSEETLTVQSSGDAHLSITPSAPQQVQPGAAQSFTVVAEDGYLVSPTVGGTCPAGSWNDSVYTTGALTADCVVSFSSAPAVATLAMSISRLALSASGLTLDGNASGQPRQIILTNIGTIAAVNVAVDYPTWPSGTSASTTCASTLPPSASCSITVTPGATATSDCQTGIAPTPGAITASADNTNAVSSDVVVLNYGCVYEEGYVFSMDDSVPATQSIGGTVAALQDHADTPVWASNGAGITTPFVSYDLIPGIDDASTSAVGSPTFTAFATYFAATYAGPLTLDASDFQQCDGKSDGACNTRNIVTYYDRYTTNYGVGAAPYTPTVAATPTSFYPAGICDTYDSGTYDDWYLPAVCELSVDNPTTYPGRLFPGCGTAGSAYMQNMEENLYVPGVVTFGHLNYWSSTQTSPYDPVVYAWNALLWPINATLIGGGDKSDQVVGVRCVRRLAP